MSFLYITNNYIIQLVIWKGSLPHGIRRQQGGREVFVRAGRPNIPHPVPGDGATGLDDINYSLFYSPVKFGMTL
jgi:hypothetical protein